MTPESTTRLRDQLIQDERLRLSMYTDSVGVHTIGVGHNLDAKPISRRAAMVILDDDIADSMAEMDRAMPWWRTLDEVRQMVLANMCFNLGLGGLLSFRKALMAMKRGDYVAAAEDMKDSKWYTQVGARAVRLVNAMETGELD